MAIFKIVGSKGAEYVSGDRRAVDFVASYWGGCDVVEVDKDEANECGGAEDVFDVISADDAMADAFHAAA